MVRRIHQSNKKNASPLPGLTLIEVVVVLAILGLLLALLTPAVHASRAVARRLQCANHLRQLGLALVNYHDAYSALPPLGSWPAGDGCPGESVVSRLFPYLGIDGLCAQVRSDVATLPILTCPADGEDQGLPGFLSYVVNHSPGRGAGSLAHPPYEYRIVTRMLDISDGLSNTSAFSENIATRSSGNLSSASTSPLRYTWMVILEPVSEDTIVHPQLPASLSDRAAQTDLSIKDCNEGPRTFSPTPNPNIDKWRDSQFGTGTATYSHWLPPNSAFCFATGAPSIDANVFLQNSRRCASAHSGGVNVVFFDGRVQFVNDRIDWTPWRAFGTRDGNESQGDDQ